MCSLSTSGKMKKKWCTVSPVPLLVPAPGFGKSTLYLKIVMRWQGKLSLVGWTTLQDMA